jgi:Glycosyltransferase
MIYVFLGDLFADDCIGVRKKVFAQNRVFAKNFGQAYCTSYSGQMMYLLQDGKVIEKEVAITKSDCNNWVLHWIGKYGIRRAYIRYMLSDKWFIKFLKELKERQIAVVLEFPTIPYEGEVSSKSVLEIDKHYREELAEYVEQCTTFSNMDFAFGIPCITLVNGIDLSQHPMHKMREPDGKIILLAVAGMCKWHGYERIIEGMANYYKTQWKKAVIFRLVGEGEKTEEYRKLIEKYHLQEYVQILGYLDGQDLDKQYDEADIAVGSLGFYKLGIESGSPIKMREYCARGIPFIYGYEDIGFSGEEDYLLQVSNDASPIKIEKIVQFYKKIQQYHGYAEDMRKYAIAVCTWDSILKPVIDYYQSRE